MTDTPIHVFSDRGEGEWVAYEDYAALLTRAETAEVAARESALQELASLGQAAEAYDAQLKAYAACDEWASVSQDNYQRAKKAEAERNALQAENDRLEHRLGAFERFIGRDSQAQAEQYLAENPTP